jgi:hypothetical protein
MRQAPTVEELRQRLGKADVQQIRLLLHVSPAQRIQTMMEMQGLVLNMWHTRLQRAHPELTALELTRLVFQRLYRNG